MERLKALVRDIGLLDVYAVVLGIAQDNPQTTKPEDFRYDTCLILNINIKTDNEDIKLGNFSGRCC